MNLIKRFQYNTDALDFLKKYQMKQVVCHEVGKCLVFKYTAAVFGKNFMYFLNAAWYDGTDNAKYSRFILDEEPKDIETIDGIIEKYGNTEPQLVEKLL